MVGGICDSSITSNQMIKLLELQATGTKILWATKELTVHLDFRREVGITWCILMILIGFYRGWMMGLLSTLGFFWVYLVGGAKQSWRFSSLGNLRKYINPDKSIIIIYCDWVVWYLTPLISNVKDQLKITGGALCLLDDFILRINIVHHIELID